MVSEEDVDDVQPLMLDKMFERVFAWGIARSAGPSSRPLQDLSTSAPRDTAQDESPAMAGVQANSPLGALFDYPELTPHILGWFERTSELAVLARVNRTFRDIARKKLYHHVWIRPWEANCDTKVCGFYSDSIWTDASSCCCSERYRAARISANWSGTSVSLATLHS